MIQEQRNQKANRRKEIAKLAPMKRTVKEAKKRSPLRPVIKMETLLGLEGHLMRKKTEASRLRKRLLPRLLMRSHQQSRKVKNRSPKEEKILKAEEEMKNRWRSIRETQKI